ncbi:MAG: hypothetical protein IKB91_03205 [Anaerotignum sp.]|nr:hypothetical protein [Anaerotignum sp.]
MNLKELQMCIDKAAHTPEDMRKIAETYLRGDVLQDLVAAEGWLMKVIESEEGKESMIAMVLLAREVLGKEQSVSEKDLAAMEEAFEKSTGKERETFLYIRQVLQEFYKGRTDGLTENGKRLD